MDEAPTTEALLAAEGALSGRQEQLESLQSQRALLADQVELSTLRVHLQPPGVAPPGGPDGFVDALGTGWRALVSAAGAAVIALGVLLPWLLVGGRARGGGARAAPPVPPPERAAGAGSGAGGVTPSRALPAVLATACVLALGGCSSDEPDEVVRTSGPLAAGFEIEPGSGLVGAVFPHGAEGQVVVLRVEGLRALRPGLRRRGRRGIPRARDRPALGRRPGALSLASDGPTAQATDRRGSRPS